MESRLAMLSLLVVQDKLEPADAIIVLGGETPYREMKAANLYRAGWAPRVIIVPSGNEIGREDALRALGLNLLHEWEIRRDALVALGVPLAAIVIARRSSIATLDELEIAIGEIGSTDAPVILVTSNYESL
jgi:uncharacterized SAM-binding protein YcdF (DUF218 family)